MKFRRCWMHKHGLQAFQCRILTVTGELMDPTLRDGCAIVVNMGQRDPRNRRIFVVRIDNEVVVERLVRDPDVGWLLRSDNPNKQAWPTRPWPGQAHIVLGEVPWMGRTFT